MAAYGFTTVHVMARTIRFHELGGPEVLRIEDLPVRSPGPGEVRIRVDAIGLNRAEVNFRRGTYVERAVLPAGLGTECSGEVIEAGPGVGRWSPGDAVGVVPSFSQNDYPVYARHLGAVPITTTPSAAQRSALLAAGAEAAFTPTVDRVFAFDDVAAAHAYVDSPDRAPGQPVLRVR
jgi:NADPH:quinone reductase-like Zn-dependent oxidoreductase